MKIVLTKECFINIALVPKWSLNWNCSPWRWRSFYTRHPCQHIVCILFLCLTVGPIDTRDSRSLKWMWLSFARWKTALVRSVISIVGWHIPFLIISQTLRSSSLPIRVKLLICQFRYAILIVFTGIQSEAVLLSPTRAHLQTVGWRLFPW